MRSLLLLTFTLSLFTVSYSQDSAAKLLSMPDYVIPPEASQAGIDGKLAVVVSVKKDGTVDRAEVVAGPSWPCGSEPKRALSVVRSGAEDAVKQARFSPALKNGKPEDREMLLTMLVGERYEYAKRSAAQKSPTSPKSDAQPSLVQGGVINGKAISLPKPDYPSNVTGARPRGTVEIEVLIDETGGVISAGALNGDPLLQDASRKSACKAQFSPTTLAGHPVKVMGIVTYNFVP
jgi:outer membrane biosynthesis protein TonB